MMKTTIEDAFKRREAPKEGPLGLLECPGCDAAFREVPKYVDHRIGEYMDQKLTEVKAPKPEEILTECKDGICKLISEHVEATYDFTKKGEEAPPPEEEEEAGGLYGNIDEPEEEK